MQRKEKSEASGVTLQMGKKLIKALWQVESEKDAHYQLGAERDNEVKCSLDEVKEKEDSLNEMLTDTLEHLQIGIDDLKKEQTELKKEFSPSIEKPSIFVPSILFPEDIMDKENKKARTKAFARLGFPLPETLSKEFKTADECLLSAFMTESIAIAQGFRDGDHFRSYRQAQDEFGIVYSELKSMSKPSKEKGADDELRTKLHLLLAESKKLEKAAIINADKIFELQLKIKALRKQLYPKFQTVVHGNRGAGARRDINAAHKLGFDVYKLHIEEDKGTPSLEAVSPFKRVPITYYTDHDNIINKLIEIREATGTEVAYHPGDGGFLGEDAVFIKKCEENNIRYIGPPFKAAELLGNKGKSKEFFKDFFPTTPDVKGEGREVKIILAEVEKTIGYPCIVKVNENTGGGRGVREAYNREEFMNAFAELRTTDVTIEVFHERIKHIEFPFVGGQARKARDCSMQRRRPKQKGVELTADPTLEAELLSDVKPALKAMHDTLGYVEAGTIELFVVYNEDGTPKRNKRGKLVYYVNELNSRLQRESPVSELAQGAEGDISESLLLAASGKPVPFSPHQPEKCVRSIRITATKGETFFPVEGLITGVSGLDPKGKGVITLDIQPGTLIKINPSKPVDPQFGYIMGVGTTQKEADANAMDLAKQLVIEVNGKSERFNLDFAVYSIQRSGERGEDYTTSWEPIAEEYALLKDKPAIKKEAMSKLAVTEKPVSFSSTQKPRAPLSLPPSSLVPPPIIGAQGLFPRPATVKPGALDVMKKALRFK